MEGIEHVEEALQENVAHDEVDTFITLQANVVDNEVDEVVATSNKGIAVTRPDLGVKCECRYSVIKRR